MPLPCRSTWPSKCLAIIKLAAPVGAKGNSNVVSDAATALYLAFAALKSALVNVNINLKFIKDEAFVGRVDGQGRRPAGRDRRRLCRCQAGHRGDAGG